MIHKILVSSNVFPLHSGSSAMKEMLRGSTPFCAHCITDRVGIILSIPIKSTELRKK